MKNFVLCLALSLLAISCTSDSENILNETGISQISNSSALPESPLNPKDYIGKKYYDALQVYLNDNKSPKSIAEITNQIEFVSNQISKPKTTHKGVIVFTDEIVESIMSDPDNSLITIVGNSSLSASAKNNLIAFLQSLLLQRQEEFSVIYAYVVAYENDLIVDSTMIQQEKDTLLTVASISRYSLYSEGERKDRDWETSVGNKHIRDLFTSEDAQSTILIAILKTLI